MVTVGTLKNALKKTPFNIFAISAPTQMKQKCHNVQCPFSGLCLHIWTKVTFLSHKGVQSGDNIWNDVLDDGLLKRVSGKCIYMAGFAS